MIIEITGGNGAGKSTIKRALIERFRGKLVEDKFVLLCENYPIWLVGFFYTLRIRLGLRIFFKLLDRINDKGAVYDFDESSIQYVSLFWEKYRHPENSRETLRIFKEFHAMLAADQCPYSSIHDEGPSKKGITLVRKNLLTLKGIENYYLKCRKPDLLIILEVDDLTRRERLVAREKSIRDVDKFFLNSSLTSQTLEVCSRVYSEAGVRVIKVDAMQPVEQVVDFIISQVGAHEITGDN